MESSPATAVVVTAVVLVAIFVTNSKGQSGKCFETFNQECQDLNTIQGSQRCCKMVRSLYINDHQCLCRLFTVTGMTELEATTYLNICDIKLTGPFPCAGGTPSRVPAPPPSHPPAPGYKQKSPESTTDYSYYVHHSESAPPHRRNFSSAAIGGIAGGGALVLLIFAGLLLFLFLWRRRRPKPATIGTDGRSIGWKTRIFKYKELVKATDGFSKANLLGQGGFGVVHKGVLPDGKEVAVKQLKTDSAQGDREFRAEIEIISRVHHKHVVSLVGYCIRKEKKLLVYNFVPNNTLELHLHGNNYPTLNWATRFKVAKNSAKGFAYLHEDCFPKIIHRDIKASNILLDYNFEPQVADFGLAKFYSEKNTDMATRVVGTIGYIDPDYAASGKPTEKSDVFSFGVVLLELITGRRPTEIVHPSMNNEYLVEWARPLLTKGLESNNYEILVDDRVQYGYELYQMESVVACAAACVRTSSHLRPTMSQIVRVLEGQVSMEELNQHMTPGFSGYHSDQMSF